MSNTTESSDESIIGNSFEALPEFLQNKPRIVIDSSSSSDSDESPSKMEDEKRYSSFGKVLKQNQRDSLRSDTRDSRKSISNVKKNVQKFSISSERSSFQNNFLSSDENEDIMFNTPVDKESGDSDNSFIGRRTKETFPKKPPTYILSDDDEDTLPPDCHDVTDKLDNLSINVPSSTPIIEEKTKKKDIDISTSKIGEDRMSQGSVSSHKSYSNFSGVMSHSGAKGRDISTTYISSDEDETQSNESSNVQDSSKENSSSISQKNSGVFSGYVPILDSTSGTHEENRTKLESEKKELQAHLGELRDQISNLQASMKVKNMLPDGGARVKALLSVKEKKYVSLMKQMEDLDSKLSQYQPVPKSSPRENILKQKCDMWSNLPKANVNLSEMGKTALKTHNTQSTLTTEALKGLHHSLETRPKDIEEAPDPTGLKVELLPHQRQALTWLSWRETQKPRGGILADDMGLGKTLTMISLILMAKEDKTNVYSDDSDEPDQKRRVKGGTLVVCPSSVMGQWEQEIKSKVVRGLLNTVVHHGPKRDTKPHRLAVYDVVLTTYNILQKDDRENSVGPLLSILWERVILDEGHIIRNYKCQTAQSSYKLRSKARWVLTGTPVHNKELDFYSLLKFLRCRPFDNLQIWKKWVDNKDATGADRLGCITRSILLRRTKEGLQQSGGLNSLKEKQYLVHKVQLDPEEWAVYEKIAHFSSTLLAQMIHQKAEKEELLSQGIPSYKTRYAFEKAEDNPFKDHPELARLHQNMISMGNVKSTDILVLLLRLRQICCHPSLVNAMLDKDEMFGEDVVDEAGLNVELMDALKRMSIANCSPSGSSTPLKDPTNSGESSNSNKDPVLSTTNPVFQRKRISSKIRAIVNCLNETVMQNDDKAIVVSQWTSVLEILAEVLRNKRISFTCLTGKIPVNERGSIIEKFNKDPRGQKVLLLSLSAGGTGLNLVGGNHLLLMDIHWNPQLEAQACDRIYRVGQTKEVYIYKFLCIDTIEERIQKLQEEKLLMANAVLTGSKFHASSKLSLKDLQLLFDLPT